MPSNILRCGYVVFLVSTFVRPCVLFAQIFVHLGVSNRSGVLWVQQRVEDCRSGTAYGADTMPHCQQLST